MDRLSFDLEVKFAGDDAEAGTIEGYGSVFGILDKGGDIMLPGAFKASLADWRKRKQLPPMLWQHDSYAPIGVWSDVAEDGAGLKVNGRLALDVGAAKDARALVAIGAVKGLSVGYVTKDYEIDRTTGVRRLKKVDLWEISLVTFPMLPEAQISGVKGMNEREYEQALRDAGLSHREAKLAVSVARDKQVLRDGGRNEPASRDGMKDVLMSLRKADAALR